MDIRDLIEDCIVMQFMKGGKGRSSRERLREHKHTPGGGGDERRQDSLKRSATGGCQMPGAVENCLCRTTMSSPLDCLPIALTCTFLRAIVCEGSSVL